ncbi:M23 family metallopeptidase [soil metagenome]
MRAPWIASGVAVLAAGLALGWSVQAPAQPPAAIVLEQPLACRFGETCFIQQYFDHDPGPGAKDYRCGARVYDGHDGVDLRVPTLAAAQRGVAVLAAAAGVVKGARDGVDEGFQSKVDPALIKNRECGNGVVIAHPGGWETQYCHMAKGSIKVAVGQTVAVSATLGQVGLSGDTDFPHMHFSVRLGNVKVDPFAFTPQAAACGQGKSLWSPAAAAALAYHDSDVLNAGFTSGPVTMEQVEAGDADQMRPAKTSAALVFYVRAIGLKAGDVQTLTLKGPDGAAMATSRGAPLDHDKAQWLAFAGKKLTASAWPAGRYAGVYAVERAGKTALTKTMTVDL